MRFTQILFARIKRDVFEDVGELTKKYSNLPESYIRRSMRQVFILDTKKEIIISTDFLIIFFFFQID